MPDDDYAAVVADASSATFSGETFDYSLDGELGFTESEDTEALEALEAEVVEEPAHDLEDLENAEDLSIDETKHLKKWDAKIDGVETTDPDFLAGDRYKAFVRVTFGPPKPTKEEGEGGSEVEYEVVGTFEGTAIADGAIADAPAGEETDETAEATEDSEDAPTEEGAEEELSIQISGEEDLPDGALANVASKATGKTAEKCKISGTFDAESEGGAKVKVNAAVAKKLGMTDDDAEIEVSGEILQVSQVATEEEKVEDESDEIKSEEEEEPVEEDAEEGKEALAASSTEHTAPEEQDGYEDSEKGAPQASEKSKDPLTDIIHKASASANVVRQQSLAERFARADPDMKLKIATDGTRVSKGGQAWIQQSLKDAAATEAALKGEIVVMSGDELLQVSPGKEKSSGVVLDWNANRAVFVGRPSVGKRSRYYDHIVSMGGAASVSGFNSDAKEEVGATVALSGKKFGGVELKDYPVPGFEDIKMGDPIFEGCQYTWEDALSGSAGIMEPDSEDVLDNVMKIAQVINQFTEDMGKGKWTITSWYRNAAHNATVGGASQSQHLSGNAVDFYFDGFMDLYNKLEPDWESGLAYMAGSFVHLDLRGTHARWTY